MTNRREDLAHRLGVELAGNTGFVRIHAAEALAEHGYGFMVSAAFHAEAGTAPPPIRVGVWRVLARIAEGSEERARFIDLLRKAMLDAQGPDRLQAAESLAKLGAANRSDRPAIEQWLASADDATAAFLLWLLLLSSDAAERARDETRLAGLLDSSDPTARLRAAYALGRLETIAPKSLDRMNERVAVEASDSPARVYLLAAAFLHASRASAQALALKKEMLAFLKTGKGNEQLEAATAIGMRGSADDAPALDQALQSREADGRIGAAGALLQIGL
jgi:SSS family solute:Na+ symporter